MLLAGGKKVAQLTIYFGDNLPVLEALPSQSVDLIYIDPPFNTGKVQSRTQLSTIRDENGDRTGFQGKRYRTVKLGTKGYDDFFDDYLAFLEVRLLHARRILETVGREEIPVLAYAVSVGAPKLKNESNVRDW